MAIKKIFIAALVAAFLVFTWSYSYVGRLAAQSESLSVVELGFADVQNLKKLQFDPRCEGDFHITRCLFNDIGYQVQAKFEGFCWQKPSYSLFDWFGGQRGWVKNKTCYGRRVVKLINTRQYRTYVFEQYFWNSGGYSEIAAHLLGDMSKDSLLLVANEFGENLTEGNVKIQAYELQ